MENVGKVEAENPSNYVIPGYLVMLAFFGAALDGKSRENGSSSDYSKKSGNESADCLV